MPFYDGPAMKHILLISRCPPYPIHLGDRLILWHLARELAGRGYTLDLLAFSSRAQDRAEIDEYRALFRQVTLIDETTRSYLKRLLWPPARFPRSAADSWSAAMWQAIEAQIAQSSYDLVHLFGGVQVYEYHHALGGLPALIVPYESYSLYLQRIINNCRGTVCRVRYSIQHWIARRYESWMFAPYRCVVVISDRDRDVLHRLNPSLPIEVIPNGVDLAYFQQRQVTRDPATLLFTGNYEYAPNVAAALRLAREILPQVQAEIPGAKLLLVGNSPPPEVWALANESITVTGRVPDLRPYLAQATVFVSPLRLGAGLKNKVLEALAMGCPLVATLLSVDGIAVTPGQEALIAEDLAAPVVRLLRDPDLQQQLSRQGRQLVEARYTWAQVADAYEALYESLLTEAEKG